MAQNPSGVLSHCHEGVAERPCPHLYRRPFAWFLARFSPIVLGRWLELRIRLSGKHRVARHDCVR